MRSKSLPIIALSAVICLWAAIADAALTMSASSTKIPRGRPSFVTVTYNVSGAALTTSQATSSTGEFLDAAGNRLGTVGTTITVPLVNGSGSARESLEIPLHVIESAIARRSTMFVYQRTFSVAAAAITISTTFQITSEAASDLLIKAVTVYFDNKRPEITVEKGFRGLHAFADIAYSGTGLLEGYWEVDGRIIARVFQNLTFGGVVKLQTPDVPELPTFDPGTHRLKFVITRPNQPIPIPTLIYFVDLDRFRPNPITITALTPTDSTSVDFAPQKFQWQRAGASSLFLVQFGDKMESKPLFSAYTRDTFYLLPESILRQKFGRGRQYFWKVIAFDDDNNIVGESRVHTFIFGQ